MSAQHEIDMALAFLYATLSTDSTLAGLAPGGVHRSVATDGTMAPYVIFGFQAGSDVSTMNGVRMIVDGTFQIKAVGPANMSVQIAEAAEQIDELFGGEQGLRNQAVTNGWIYAVWRQSPIYVDEPPVNAQVWTSVGGLYRIQLSSTS